MSLRSLVPVLASVDPVLIELALLFALCAAVVVVCWRIGLPPIAGFLVAGAVIGPSGFGWIQHRELVTQLAEIGVVVLLFTIGLELSLAKLLKLRRVVGIGGSIQVALTATVGTAVALAVGLSTGPAVFCGFLLSLSSTAAVTKLLLDRGAIASPSGRFAVSMCVAQDLAVVPMILALPILAGGGVDGGGSVWLDALRTLGLLLAVAAGTRLVVPLALDLAARTRSREVFVLMVIASCLGVALLTGILGVSLALGSFIAGLVIADSRYQHQAVSEIEPLRDALASLFFVSIGMLFDVRLLIEQPLVILIALAATVLGKALVILIAAAALKLPFWIALRSALLLAQIGEFSFVLLQLASDSPLLSPELEGLVIAVAVLSIALTPLWYALGVRWTGRAAATSGKDPATESSGRVDHVVICGYGPVGAMLQRALAALDQPHVVVEMNAKAVKEHAARGVPIVYGDCTRSHTLRAVGIERSRLLVLTINDTDAMARAAELARRLCPRVRVLARALYLQDVEALLDNGVDEVVPQELETAIEVMVRALRSCLIADDDIGRQVRAIRGEYRAARTAPVEPSDAQRLDDFVSGLGFRVVQVGARSPAVGKTLADLDLRKVSGCTMVAVRRDATVDTAIDAATTLAADDVVVLVGPQSRLQTVDLLFRSPSSAPIPS